MARINTLFIRNFKFFGQAEPLRLDGKHLLLYGENGSGKSTIYWALYTLLEAAAKQYPEDINKYFRRGPGETNSLVNIHAMQDAVGDCQVALQANLDNDRKYSIALHDTDIRLDPEARRSNAVSDFMHYRMLYKAYDFAHSETNDLYPLFEREILPYVDFSGVPVGGSMPPAAETKASKILEHLFKDGPGEWINAKGDVILAPKHTETYKKFDAQLRQFNSDLDQLLTHINIRGNQLLADDFGYKNFQFRLELSQRAYIDKKDKRFIPYKPKIELKIPQYSGIMGIIHKPQSFLNEARLSALALCMRLAVLEKNYEADAELKLLVLDDLLLSLDMGNRDRVLELLLGRYANQYQILLLTHEFRFFEIAKKRIEHTDQAEDWIFYEMYASEPSGQPPRPVIILSETYLGKARRYYREHHDFAAAGNYLRKEAEKFVKRFLPQQMKMTKSFAEMDLNGMINQALVFVKSNSLNTPIQEALRRLDEHRKFIFNPLSHDSFDVSMLKNDLERAFSTLEFLHNLESRTILKMGDQLLFELHDPGGDLHRFEIQVCGELKMFRESPSEPPVLARCPFYCVHFMNGTQSPKPSKFNDLPAFFADKYDKSDGAVSPNFWETIVLTDGSPLLSLT